MIRAAMIDITLIMAGYLAQTGLAVQITQALHPHSPTSWGETIGFFVLAIACSMMKSGHREFYRRAILRKYIYRS